MKKFFRSWLAMTGLTLLLLAVTASLYHAHFIFVSGVYQTGLVNFIIQLGLLFFKRVESKYYIAEITVEIGWILAVAMTAGYFFGWFQSMPAPMWVLFCIVVYFACCLFDIIRVHNDVNTINERIRLRKEMLNAEENHATNS